MSFSYRPLHAWADQPRINIDEFLQRFAVQASQFSDKEKDIGPDFEFTCRYTIKDGRENREQWVIWLSKISSDPRQAAHTVSEIESARADAGSDDENVAMLKIDSGLCTAMRLTEDIVNSTCIGIRKGFLLMVGTPQKQGAGPTAPPVGASNLFERVSSRLP